MASGSASGRRRRSGSVESFTQGWLGLDEDGQSEDLARTPTSRSIAKKQKARNSSLALSFSEHRSQDSTDTLRPSEHWGSSSPTSSAKDATPLPESSYPRHPQIQVTKMDSSYDKPLPTPPFERTASEMQPPSPIRQTHTSNRPSVAQAPSFQRTKKRVAWRGKACIIALPIDDGRGSQEGRPLLSPRDVQEKLKQWEREGKLIDTLGDYNEAVGSQSRPIHPSAEDIHHERRSSKLRVRIPDKAEWDTFIKELAEAKLRALGVTFGDESPPPSSRPTPAPGLSRASSQLSNLPISPAFPGPTMSGSFMQGGQMFSPPAFASTNSSTHPGSFASPVTPYANLPPHLQQHRARQSIAVPMDPRTGSPFNLQHLQTTPGLARGPSPGSYFPQRTGTISPSGINSLPNVGDILSPVSPMNREPSIHSTRQPSTLDQMRMQQQELQAQLLHQQQQQLSFGQPTPQTPMFGQRGNTPEILHPTPQGHHRNVSEALERGVDSSENVLERSIRHQLERSEHRQNQHEKTPLIDEESHDYDRKEDDILKGLDLDQTDEELNSSVPPSPELPHAHPSTSRPAFGHRSKPSLSMLNVQAKPFDPQAAFASSNFTFGGNSFQPQAPSFKPPLSTFNSNGSGQNRPLFGSVIDTSVPAFKPAAAKNEFSSSDFKFSASSFNVEAPAFNPTGTSNVLGGPPKPTEEVVPNKIFGDFKLEEIVKPARRSKAVPIIRPDSKHSSPGDDEARGQLQEDKFGRPEPTLFKRARRRGSDGESEVQFAPSSPALNEIGLNRSPAHTSPKPSAAPVGKENEKPQSSLTSPISPPAAEHEMKRDPPKTKESGWRSFDFAEQQDKGVEKDKEETDIENEKLLHEEELSDDSEVPIEKPPTPPSRTSSGHRHSKSSLSAAAPPFVPTFSLPTSPSQETSAVFPSVEKGIRALPTPPPAPTPTLPPIQAPVATTVPAAASIPSPVTVAAPAPSALKEDSRDSSKRNSLKASRWAVESSPPLPTATSSSEPEEVNLEESPSPRLSAEESAEESGAESIVPTATEEEARDSEIPSSELERPADGVKHIGDMSTDSESDKLPGGPESPSFEDIDAVMRAMDENPELGVERTETPRENTFPTIGETPSLDMPVNLRSDAPSPSPKRVAPYQTIAPEDLSENERVPLGLGILAGANKLEHRRAATPSDWNDALSVGDEDRFNSRATFFDGHVNELVGGLLEDRLRPFERSLDVIQKSIALLASKPTGRSRERPVSHDSDADDEDDEDVRLRPESARYRSRSPMPKTDRRVEQMKAVVREALAAYQPPEPKVSVDYSRIHEVLAEMKLLAEPESLQGRTSEMKRVLEDVISTHPRLSRGSSRAAQDLGGGEKLKLQVDGLESMLKVANERAEEEYRSRRLLELELAEAQAARKLAEEQTMQHRDAAEEAERSLRNMVEEKNAAAPDADDIENLQQTIEGLTMKNNALDETLEEYRISHSKWQDEMEEERSKTKALRATMLALRRQIDDSSEGRKSLRGRFDKLQDDMAMAAQDTARELLSWKRKEETYISKNERMQAALDHELKARERAENSLYHITKEHEKMLTLQPLYEKSQTEVDRLEELVLTLREEGRFHQDTVSRLEREMLDTKQTSRSEYDILRNELESEVGRLNKQVSDAHDELIATTSKHQAALQELHDSKTRALQEAANTREAALEEEHRVHERALNDLRSRHGRVLHNASEDKQRMEEHLSNKMAFSEEKIAHLEDKVSHLEEKLSVAKEAAKAAAEAAANSGSSNDNVSIAQQKLRQLDAMPSSTMPSMPYAVGSTVPEKISPQALRESIMVLQDQLQNREATIESLQSQLGAIDKSLPSKLKERDIEVTWLRELLGVRLDDLQDIINTLTSGDDFDKEAARNAAVRLKASLEMEQQLRERQMPGSTSPSLPSFSSITSQLAAVSASPRATAQALPMAAAAAWGNWRKARDLSSSITDLASSVTATPSRPASSTPAGGSFLSGLMTPPATTSSQRMSATPTPSTAPPAGLSLSGRRISTEARPLRGYSSSQPRKLGARSESTGPRPLRRVTPVTTTDETEEPRTPTASSGPTGDLLRQASYDDDAETRTIISAFGDEESSSSVGTNSVEKMGRGFRDDMASANRS